MDVHAALVTAFWAATAIVLYVYAGYPVLLACWAWLVRRAGARRETPRLAGARSTGARHEKREADAYPPVSIVIAVRNEAARLSARLENLIGQDYPADRQIIVVSDGSTDDTPRMLAEFGDRVELVPVPPGGKALALNAGVARARHAIVVFADARQQFAPDALRFLVAPFADPRVGVVSGQLVLDAELRPGDDLFDAAPDELKDRRRSERRRNPRPTLDRRTSDLGRSQSTIGAGASAYWKYEKWLRRHETIVGSMLGATGAIYAIRREAWRPLPAGTLLDDVLAPMRAALDGFRVIFEERALAFDAAAADAVTEWRRKVRTLAGNYQVLVLEPRLLLPGVNPVWLQYLSHKVGRLIVPWALLVTFAASALMAPYSILFAAIFAGQAAFYALAAYGAWLERAVRGAVRPELRSAPGASRLSPATTTVMAADFRPEARDRRGLHA